MTDAENNNSTSGNPVPPPPPPPPPYGAPPILPYGSPPPTAFGAPNPVYSAPNYPAKPIQPPAGYATQAPWPQGSGAPAASSSKRTAIIAVVVAVVLAAVGVGLFFGLRSDSDDDGPLGGGGGQASAQGPTPSTATSKNDSSSGGGASTSCTARLRTTKLDVPNPGAPVLTSTVTGILAGTASLVPTRAAEAFSVQNTDGGGGQKTYICWDKAPNADLLLVDEGFQGRGYTRATRNETSSAQRSYRQSGGTPPVVIIEAGTGLSHDDRNNKSTGYIMLVLVS